MKKLLVLLIGLGLLSLTSCGEFPPPTMVTKEVIPLTDSTQIIKTYKYELVKVSEDTVKVKKSTRVKSTLTFHKLKLTQINKIMIIEVEGSAEQPYKVDTENLTCTCPNFRFKCRHFSMDNPDRLCKHLHEVFEKHPELKPASLNKQESLMANGGVEKDGKTRYPREVFDLYT